MLEILDTGKVWLKGKVNPDYGLRVGENIFVPGKEADDEFNCWIDGDFLCVDLLNKNLNRRIARKFPLNAKGDSPAALFSGFTKTKHADIMAVTSVCDGFEEYILQGVEFFNESIFEMSCHDFWKNKAFPEN